MAVSGLVLAIFIWSFSFADNVLRLIQAQLQTDLITKGPSGGFILFLQMAVVMTIVCLFPLIIYAVIYYIKPALYKKEKKILRKAIRMGFLASLLFFLGVVFAVFMVFTIIIPFMTAFNSTVGITNIWDAQTTVMFILFTCLYTGLLFQTPIVVYFGLEWKLLDIKHIKQIRKALIVVALVVSAVITPPDIISQVLFGAPVLVLFEISVMVWRYKNRIRNR
jgi:sec-independent protein translocase protein TatC